MNLKSKKTSVIIVIALLMVIQLVFAAKNSDKEQAVNNTVVENNTQEGTVDEKNLYDEEIVPTKLNVVYNSSHVMRDISEELESSKDFSVYENKIVSYTSSTLTIYSEPDSASEMQGVMYSGSEADILEKGPEWTKVQSGEVVGYVRNLDVLFGEEAEEIASTIGKKQAEVKADVTVYADADSSSEVISYLASGATIDAYEDTGVFTLVSCDNGFGYVDSKSVAISYGLDVAKTKAEIEAIAEAERKKAAEEAARRAAAEAAAAATANQQKEVTSNVTMRNAYNVSEEEVHLLAAIIYWESGWEPADGQLAVANVVLNRVFSSRFAQNTIASVIYAPGQFAGVVENGAPSARFQGVLNMSNEQLNQRGCYNTALRALAGENNIGNMLFFINVKKANFGKYTGYTIINNHCFYTY